MAATEKDPVIVSSNRYKDVEPYTNRLFSIDSKKWSQVLPWEFPQNGSQEQEEEFLRGFFDEREIYVQGGAPDGYRFLKQVWYSAALWNIKYRLPAVVKYWFEAHEKELKDSSMKEACLHPGAKVKTFFLTKDIETFGEKFLEIVVKQIQFQIDPSCNNVPPEKPSSTEQPTCSAAEEKPVWDFLEKKRASTITEDKPASASASTEANPAPAHGEEAKAAISETKARPSKLAAQSPSFEPMQAQVPPASAPAQYFATKPFKAVSTPGAFTPNFAQAGPPDQRSFSGDAYIPPMQRELQPSKRRGSNGFNKHRNSFNGNRPYQRPNNAQEGQFQPPSSPYVPSAGHYAGPGMMPPPRGRIPSGTPYERGMEHMAALPQGQPFDPQAAFHGQQFAHHHGPQHTPQYPAEPPGFMGMQPYAQSFNPTSGNFVPGMVERSNVGGEPYHGTFEDSSGRLQKRRDSNGARGGRGNGRGSKGSIRGRGSKGRNSFSQTHINSGMDPNTFTRNPFNNGSMAMFSAQDSRSSFKHGNPFGTPSRSHVLDENTMPRRIERDDGTFHIPDNSVQAPFMSPGTVNQNAMPNYRPRRMSGSRDYIPLCTQECATDYIDPTCTQARKLIIFSVLKSAPQNELYNYFEQFGKLKEVSQPISSYQYNVQAHSNRAYVHVVFDHVDGARKCLAARGAPWPFGDHSNLLVEVVHAHFDPNHRSHAWHSQNAGSESADAVLSTGPSASLVQLQAESSNLPLNSFDRGQSLPVQQEPGTGDSTPTASALSSPRKKTKNKNNKGKKKSAARDDAEKKGQKPSRQDSLIGPSVLATDQEDVTGSLSQIPEDHGAEAITDLKSSPVAAEATIDQSSAKTGDAFPIPPQEESSYVAQDTPAEINAAPEPSSPKEDEQSIDASGVVEDTAAAAKAEDDQNDESFHTASDSPDHLGPTEKKEDEAVASTASMAPSSPFEETKTSIIVKEDASAGGDETTQEESPKPAAPSNETKKPQMRSPTSTKDAKKAPIPQIPKNRQVSIVIPPPIDTAIAPVPSKTSDEGSLKVPQQRSTSGSSEVPPSAFVTAPNTPAVPAPDEGDAQKTTDDQAEKPAEPKDQKPLEADEGQIPSDAEAPNPSENEVQKASDVKVEKPPAPPQAQQEKAAKSRGPEQTESFSIFGKKEKKPKAPKQKKGSMKGKPKLDGMFSPSAGSRATSRAVSGVSTPIPENSAPSMASEDDSKQNNAIGHKVVNDDEADTTFSAALTAESQDETKHGEVSSPKEKDDGRPRTGTFSFLGGIFGRNSSQTVAKEAKTVQDEVKEAPQSVGPELKKRGSPVPEAAPPVVTEMPAEGKENIEVTPETAVEKIAPEGNTKTDLDRDDDETVEPGSVGLGISPDATTSAGTKSKKKKKKSNKNKGDKAKVETLEMSNQVLDAHVDQPLTVYEGNSEGEAAAKASQKSAGLKVARKTNSGDDHLVKGPTLRRKLPRRPGSSSRKGSESTNDSEQNASSSEAADARRSSHVWLLHPRNSVNVVDVDLVRVLDQNLKSPKALEEAGKDEYDMNDRTVDEDRASPEVEEARKKAEELARQEQAKKEAAAAKKKEKTS